MAVAAKLRALTVIHALLLGAEPGLVEPTRHSVHLDAEGGHREGMKHIAGGDLHLNDLVHGNDHVIVDCQQAGLVGLEVLRLHHVRIELEAAALVGRIFVIPVP
jgi:hypothetical protein